MTVLQPLKHFDGTRDARRPMARVDNVREAAKDFRRDMLAKPKVRFYKSFELVRVPFRSTSWACGSCCSGRCAGWPKPPVFPTALVLWVA